MAAFSPDRRTFLRGAGFTLAAAASAPLLAACGSGSAKPAAGASAQPVRGGKAILAIEDNPVDLDPADGQLYSSLQVYQNIFSELLEVDANYSFKPNLASSWTQEDASTWKFSLVDNAYFQNGEPVTATDVAYTINRMKTKSLGIYLQFFDKVDVLDTHTCRIHLAKPYGPMEATMASLVDITNQKAIESTNPKSNPIGCGPYKLARWVKGSHVTLERWDKYFKTGRPYLDQVTFQSVSDDTVRLTGLQTGQFDWIQAVPPQQVDSLMKTSGIEHTSAGPFLPYLILLNATAPPFNDVRVRQAVSWAVDRSEIVKLAFFGSAVEAAEAISAPNPFYSGVNPYRGGPDLDKAKALMRQAGVSNLDVSFIVEQEVPEYATMGQILQSQLAKIGINLHLQTVSSAEYFGILAGKKYGMAATYFSASLDPALAYYLLGYSTSAFNLSGLKSSQLDSLLNKFTFEADQSARKQVYPELVNAFAEQAPFIFLANQQQRYWTTPALHGAEPLPSLEIRAEDLWKSA
jgi:peptide/nickel transport system substrate-binding protein